jgi:hypothetical protein
VVPATKPGPIVPPAPLRFSTEKTIADFTRVVEEGWQRNGGAVVIPIPRFALSQSDPIDFGDKVHCVCGAHIFASIDAKSQQQTLAIRSWRGEHDRFGDDNIRTAFGLDARIDA